MNDTATTAQQQTTLPGLLGQEFADVWCGALTHEIASSLNCEEVDVLVNVLRALGADQAADEWIEAHAQGDEPGDNHYQDPNAADALSADAFRWRPDLEET
ncbi:hypothetical protein ACFXMT_35545 [Streptomyces mirabilis]|uniref:hypothetical protein n=1 Tax=Streptomyces mirabilis TaxID=68239 RepID=UPI00368132C0